MNKNKKIVIIVISIVVVVLIVLAVLFIGIPTYLGMQARKSLENTINNEDVLNQLDEQEKYLFNQRFTAYETEEDSSITSTHVFMLFSVVSDNNANDERKVDVNGTIITSDNIDAMKACINKDLQYKIKCIYDEEGYVKTIELKYA